MNFIKSNLDVLTPTRDFNDEISDIIDRVLLNVDSVAISDLIELSSFFNVTIDELIKSNLAENQKHHKNIKLLILDVDGVLTDGGMYYTELGDDFKKFNTKDGMGIKKLINRGVQVGIISASFIDKLVKRRAQTLGIEKIYVGKESKINILNKWLKEMNIKLSEVAYIGDDINDAEIMEKIGLSACPNDASYKIKAIADIILNRKGGEGCVREFIETYLAEV
jgi:YrbI family 3-deoxy-D-manno-octulosonate 8-phosphate phosphatase